MRASLRRSKRPAAVVCLLLALADGLCNPRVPIAQSQQMVDAIGDALLARLSPLELRSHPGFAMSLGCDEWRGAGYGGEVTGWSAEGRGVRWIASSRMRQLNSRDDEGGLASSRDATSRPLALFDLLAFASEDVDVPHLRVSLEQQPNGGSAFRVQLDYTPRSDLIASFAHFDKYFKGIDAEVQALVGPLAQRGACRAPRPAFFEYSLLPRMTASPFALELDVDDAAAAQSLCAAHVDRWLCWVTRPTAAVTAAAPPPASASVASDADQPQVQVARRERDTNAARLLYEEYKLRYAAVMGASFAPFAEPIALACLGPG